MLLQTQGAADLKERLDLINRPLRDGITISAFPEVFQSIDLNLSVISPASVLPLEEKSHDLVLHALHLHGCEDPVGQLIQCRRALRPDGVLLANTLGGTTLQELRAALAQAESEVRGGLSPRVAPMADIRDLGALLGRAGLALPVADSFVLTLTYESLFDLGRDLRLMGEGNALAGRPRHPTGRRLFERAEQIYGDAYGLPDGRLPASFEIVTLTGWAPDATQPQPLRPGSAVTRLADALGTEETVLPREPGDN